MNKQIIVYDTTLRDGWQDPRKELPIALKSRVYNVISDLSPDYIEGCWPSSSAEDMDFLSSITSDTRVAAFGSTANPNNPPSEDRNLNDIVGSGVKVATIFGKTWKKHIEGQLCITPEENLELIRDSVGYLREHGLEVIYDAEHFFSGWKENCNYAFRTLEAALDAGASTAVLCDTKGGASPKDVYIAAKQLQHTFKDPDYTFGIHVHDDTGCATANTLIFCDTMLEYFNDVHIQGTINGLGERCGNADLCTILPDLELKYGLKTGVDISRLTMASKRVADITGIAVAENRPYVGRRAFAHKGGMHVDAVAKMGFDAYNHVDPRLVGNSSKILSGNQSGKANVMLWLDEFGYQGINKSDARVRSLLSGLKDMTESGYDINGNKAEQMLLVHRYFGAGQLFRISDFSTSELREYKGRTKPRARTIMSGHVYQQGQQVPFEELATSEHGPVDSQKLVLIKTLEPYHPCVSDIRLVDYLPKISKEIGSRSYMRVPIKLTDGDEVWETIGVSDSILEASLEALHKGFIYKLIRDKYRNL